MSIALSRFPLWASSFQIRKESVVARFITAGMPTVLLAVACGGYGSAPPPGASGGADVVDASDCPSCPGTSGTSSGSVGQGGTSGATTGGSGSGGANPVVSDAAVQPDFQPRSDYAGPCVRAAGAIDVNLGNQAENFVRAAYCQVNGTEPAATVVSGWANQLRTIEYVRRIDVVRTFCSDAGRTCTLSYSDPWLADIPLAPVCQRKTARDLGAVLMFFSDCPGQVNCRMDWANTHAHGMTAPHQLFAFGSAAANYYNPRNAGYWYRQLLDARWAGLQFFLLNVYGPDLARTPDPLAMLGQALTAAGPGVKVALFDDPSGWGQPTSPAPFQVRPNLSDTEGAAQAIYTAKWKPFYSRVDRQYWYELQNRPFIYFYNSGTLVPLNVSAAVVSRLKQLFAQDFGVTPFVVVDTAYFQDPNMPNVADSQFTWDTLRTGRKSRSTLQGTILDHFMVKWDTVGRDKPGVIASAADRILKGTALLADRLATSQDAQVAVIATWNDLGEGTGIERNYDYYVAGSWLAPSGFIGLTRASQCSD
jgi:uncharacterized protein DUF5010